MQIIQKTSLFLRLWCVEGIQAKSWRAEVEIPETGEHVGFASLEQLFAFLLEFTERRGHGNQNGKNIQKEYSSNQHF
jgi:hypothetical protein